ncbi:MAG: restriction endonuclease subunit S [Candidatus Accumulibacter sp.]|uniref:Restriction endonuclease subunit S n=1 Tax=Candidatus Accumulibacter cognatus TaxID=2954383 RepID=A0A7D5NCM0_9PROT|nr:restriction endonuclease subunit S [Accumulibacter sp.]MBN8516541.1 restriction endonuclease subunit S [Accumulibacter sp.]MBO3712607.1 restriction endonuclease subunit S [Accumulibacter sp.]QLH50493.1 MAG: restriction endonuclease subunit S [Candidatus Accumulibacter cognatus]
MGVRLGYKKTDVGVIPDEWQVRQLAEVSRKITDGDHVTPKRESQGYYLLSARNVLNGRIDVSDVDYVGADEYWRMKQRCGPEAGDILISCSGTIGRVAVVPADFECVLVRSAALAKINCSSANGVFIQYWLQGRRAQKQIANSVNQGAQPNLFLNHIERLACPLPPLPEQRAIAEALSDVDALLGALDRLIAKKRDLKQAAMQQLLTGQTRLPGFHGEWEVKTIAELERLRLVRLSRGQVISKRHIDGAPGDFPIYSSSIHNNGLFGRYGDFMFDEELITWSVDGGGNFFYRPKHKFSVTNVCGFMRAEPSRINYRFLAAELQLLHSRKSFDYQSKAHPSVVRNEYVVQLPPLPEQTAIADVLGDMEAEIVALEQRREKTRALKQAMMQELLTGRTRLVCATA